MHSTSIPPAVSVPTPRARTGSAAGQRYALVLVLSLLAADLALPAEGLAGAAAAHSRHQKKRNQTGLASFYGPECRNRITANGERFDPTQLTAAHRTLPFGTRVRVTNLENGRHVVVRINDRGPYRKGRVLDLTRAAARKLGFVHDGVAHVRLEVLKGRAEPRGRMAGGLAAPRRTAARSPRHATRRGSSARA